MTLSRLMKEAHERAREDFVWIKANNRPFKPYSYFLGLQMRSGFKEQRAAEGFAVPSYQLGQDRWY